MAHKHYSKPFMEMTPKEFEKSWDDLSRDIHESLLNEARNGVGQEILIAVALLTIPGRPDAIALRTDEYGDREGIKHVDDFIGSCRRSGLLRPGEKLRRVVYLARDLTMVGKQPKRKTAALPESLNLMAAGRTN